MMNVLVAHKTELFWFAAFKPQWDAMRDRAVCIQAKWWTVDEALCHHHRVFRWYDDDDYQHSWYTSIAYMRDLPIMWRGWMESKVYNWLDIAYAACINTLLYTYMFRLLFSLGFDLWFLCLKIYLKFESNWMYTYILQIATFMFGLDLFRYINIYFNNSMRSH